MATKAPAFGSKRKIVSGGREKFDGKNKKPRLEQASNGKTSGSEQTSRESHAKQKQLALERKAAKPLADEVQRTKKIWERLRLKSHVPKDERQQLVAELYGIITGRIRDFVLKHDAVRAVQTAIKYSTPEQRKQIATELQGTYAQLAEGRYAKFLIGKLLVHNDDEVRDIIIPNFYGKVRKLINHSEASWILDDIYRTVATKEQKALLLREWYGPEFTLKELTKDVKATSDLKQILNGEPSKRGPIMKSLLDLINSLIQKRMTGFTMLHDAMLQYFINTQPGTEESTEFMELVKGDETGDLLKNLAFTRSGAKLVCLLLAHGTAKDRKVLLKAYKDTITLMSGDQYGHVVILTAYDVIDDTKLTSKAIFPELLGEKEEEMAQNVVAAANNPNARITLLYLLEGFSKSLFPASHAYDQDVLKEVHEIRKGTSKKEDGIRRKELAALLSPSLIAAIAASPSDLTASPFGCQFVADVLLSGIGDKQKALEALAQCVCSSPKQGPAEDEIATRPHLANTPFGGRMLKSLIQGGRFDKATGKVKMVDPPLGFSNVLYPVVKKSIMDWATGPSSFVVVALLESEDFASAEELKKTLKKNQKLLQEAAVEPTAEQKAAKEAGEGDETGKKGKKTEAPVGNKGSKLLLEKL
ncbi:pumilio domain-containing [Trichoderma cornu-damae]|uniref:Pumilio domain-containing n=1 Tax=Trichoderma cornu-damae TaxID=654480 RepID=A0A9P8TZK0_9HYPO|nr:pumilio domain-containing [Trichoderma cornu-damae]